MSDKTYIFGQDINNYTPFYSEEINCDDNDSENNFCPYCHYNLKSDKHIQICGHHVPIGDNILPIILLCSIYIIIKLFKTIIMKGKNNYAFKR